MSQSLKSRIRASIAVAPGLCVLVALAPGCSEKDDEPNYMSITGTAEGINPVTNEVTMRWFSVKKKRYMSGTAIVTDDTEVLVNGKTAKLEDIKKGEKIKARVRIEGEGTDRQIFVTSVDVVRPQDEWPGSEAQPAGPTRQPAETAASSS